MGKTGTALCELHKLAGWEGGLRYERAVAEETWEMCDPHKALM